MVTTLDDTETFEPSVTPMISKVLLSEVFLIEILPLSASTFSLKVSTIFALAAIFTELSLGVEDVKVGFEASLVVKSSVVFAEIPAYELLEGSSKSVASIVR